MKQFAAAALCLCISAGVFGCGGQENVSKPLAPISGKIQINGSPLAGATVTFQPLDKDGKNQPSSSGKTDSEGKYKLEVPTNGRKGAVVGEHSVSISHPDDNASASTEKDAEDAGLSLPKPPRRIPERYSTTSQFKFTVTKEGAADADFELTSP